MKSGVDSFGELMLLFKQDTVFISMKYYGYICFKNASVTDWDCCSPFYFNSRWRCLPIGFALATDCWIWIRIFLFLWNHDRLTKQRKTFCCHPEMKQSKKIKRRSSIFGGCSQGSCRDEISCYQADFHRNYLSVYMYVGSIIPSSSKLLLPIRPTKVWNLCPGNERIRYNAEQCHSKIFAAENKQINNYRLLTFTSWLRFCCSGEINEIRPERNRPRWN